MLHLIGHRGFNERIADRQDARMISDSSLRQGLSDLLHIIPIRSTLTGSSIRVIGPSDRHPALPILGPRSVQDSGI